jgi:hypothetical protein
VPLKLITLATDGTTNHIVLPNGHRQNLGTVSPMKVVMALMPKREARRLLDEFNKEGQTMFRADLEVLGDLLAPKRTRWGASTDPLISRQERDTHPRRGNKMAQDSEVKGAIAQQIARIEAQIKLLSEKAGEAGKGSQSQLSISNDVANLKKLVSELGKAPAPQSSNTYFYHAAAQQEAEQQAAQQAEQAEQQKQARREQARFEEGKPADPTENMSPEDAEEWEKQNDEHKDQFKAASVQNLNRNASLVEHTLSRVTATGQKIDQLEAAGKRFDSVRAREDLSRVASVLRDLVASADLAQPYVTTEVQKIARQAAKLADLFNV